MGGGGGECLLSNFFFFFFAAIIGLQFFFFLGMCLTHFFGKGGAVKFGLYVFRHNNNFNLINIYSAKTYYNRIQKKLRIYLRCE